MVCSNPEFNYWHWPGSWLKTPFCKPCAKAKSAGQPFPKESQTWTTKYGERVHWDLWGLASVKNLNGNYYVAACIDDATCENKFYFQEKKSETCDSYKWDDALIETQSGNHINISHSDWVGEFLSKELIQHQDSKGTVHEPTVHDSPQQNGVSEHGMHTWAEHAWALLLASGLPQYLWEEAMKHSTWLQERTPACALNGKTPYEMKNKKKPHLASIHEFSVAAYVKDLKAGNLDDHAQIGWFIGYDSESKGYCIYWPNKQSITVECNVIFNEDDVLTTNDIAIIPGNVLAKGERDKIIQNPTPNANTDKWNVNQLEFEAEKADVPDPEPTNTIPFPSESHPTDEPEEVTMEEEDELPQLGQGHHVQKKPPGAYHYMAEAKPPLLASVAEFDLDDDEENKILPDDDGMVGNLPPDFALLGGMGTEPWSFDEVLHGPNAKEWQASFNYEISQLKKLGTWVIKDLPKGHTAIPCRGLEGEVRSNRWH